MVKKKNYIISNLEITDVASEGKAIARHEGKVVFVKHAVPGDVADVRVYREKRAYAEAEPLKFHSYSPKRTEPFCSHFGVCGGCKWQHLDYQYQLEYKHKQVIDQLNRVGKIYPESVLPILGAEETRFYRNKLEYTFSSQRWMTEDEIEASGEIIQRNGLGFHIPGRFDKVLDVERCWLQEELTNALRNEVRHYALGKEISFFNLRTQEGSLRNLIVRSSSTGEWMLIFCFSQPVDDALEGLMEHIRLMFPQVSSLLYVVNQKKNDTIHDLPVHVYHGRDHLIEMLGDIKYRVSPKSFFQTNTVQAKILYDVVKDFAGLTGTENVYDLYTGTGSIACYLAGDAKHITGIEYVSEAIEDAHLNAGLNGISNLSFYSGDIKDVLNDELVALHGKPDVLITDPPRAGMHEDVVKRIISLAPHRIVYVSCNPATQARDLSMLASYYKVLKVQPVDMFPHTHHVENVALLERV